MVMILIKFKLIWMDKLVEDFVYVSEIVIFYIYIFKFW